MKNILLLAVCLMMLPLISQADDDYYCDVNYDHQSKTKCEVNDVVIIRDRIGTTVAEYCDFDAPIILQGGGQVTCRLRKPREERK